MLRIKWLDFFLSFKLVACCCVRLLCLPSLYYSRACKEFRWVNFRVSCKTFGFFFARGFMWHISRQKDWFIIREISICTSFQVYSHQLNTLLKMLWKTCNWNAESVFMRMGLVLMFDALCCSSNVKQCVQLWHIILILYFFAL